jgi:hypothetical protein
MYDLTLASHNPVSGHLQALVSLEGARRASGRVHPAGGFPEGDRDAL